MQFGDGHQVSLLYCHVKRKKKLKPLLFQFIHAWFYWPNAGDFCKLIKRCANAKLKG